jgi:hypothetical protein
LISGWDYTARTAIYDLGIFYQAVKSYSEFKPGYSIAIKRQST